MILALMIAGSVASAAPPPPSQGPVKPASPSLAIGDIAHAINAGRLEQARLMLASATAIGLRGPQIDRLTADLEFASRNWPAARDVYERLLATSPGNAFLCERSTIASLQLADADRAARWVACATAASNASWRAWNAQGVLADMKSDWAGADAAFARAIAIAPNRAEVLNNKGWSLLMRGRWSDAAGFFEQAVSADPGLPRAANNLELARSALSGDLPARRVSETDESWAARLNDAGVASQIMGNRTRAVAAFTEALEASGSWYERAANNLSTVRAGQ